MAAPSELERNTGAAVPRASGGIFLSYRRQDQHVAGRLADGLIMRFGRERVFLDVETIEPGTDFVAAITEAVGRCDVLIAVIGPQWATLPDRTGQRRKLDDPQDFVTLEIRTALERGIRVIPVLVDDAVMPRPEELPESLLELGRRQAVEVEHGSFHSDLQRVLSAIDATLQAIAAEARTRESATARSVAPTRPDGFTDRKATGKPGAGPSVRRSFSPVDGPTEALRSVPPPHSVPLSQAAVDQRAVGPTSRRIPWPRTAIRIALWWLVFVISLFTSAGVGITIKDPGKWPIMTPIIGFAVLGLAVAGAAAFLRREISAQRRLLDQSGPARVAPRATTPAHVRRVALICLGACVVFGVLMTLPSPPR